MIGFEYKVRGLCFLEICSRSKLEALHHMAARGAKSCIQRLLLDFDNTESGSVEAAVVHNELRPHQGTIHPGSLHCVRGLYGQSHLKAFQTASN